QEEGEGGRVSAPAVAGPVAWRAGDYCTTTTTCGNGQLLPFLLRWTGDAWQPTPPPAKDVTIFGLAVLSSTNAWAVGYTHPRTTLILHWNTTNCTYRTRQTIRRRSTPQPHGLSSLTWHAAPGSRTTATHPEDQAARRPTAVGSSQLANRRLGLRGDPPRVLSGRVGPVSQAIKTLSPV